MKDGRAGEVGWLSTKLPNPSNTKKQVKRFKFPVVPQAWIDALFGRAQRSQPTEASVPLDNFENPGS